MNPFPKKGDRIDLHTHRQDIPDGEFALVNLFVQDTNAIPEAANRAFSVGLHPWHLEQVNLKKQMEKLGGFSRHPGVAAIGEAGLDRAVDIDMSVQLKLFHFQLDLAEESMKPLLVHCVRAYSDLLHVLKERRPRIPLVVHAFRGNSEMAARLLEKEVWLSFGRYITHPASRQASFFAALPPEKVFLETDVSSFPLADLYLRASTLTGWTPDKWAEQIYHNYHDCFRTSS